MLNPSQSVDVSSPPTACYKLRISYFEDSDVIAIEHYSSEGKLLSEARLSPEDAYSYAQSIIDVFDEALGVE